MTETTILTDRMIGVLGLIGTVFGLILAGFFYLKSRKTISGAYYIQTNHLIGPLRSRFGSSGDFSQLMATNRQLFVNQGLSLEQRV